jgi:hypothetical protein
MIRRDEVICNHTVCQTESDGLPLYRASGHLNHLDSAFIGKRYLAGLRNSLSILAVSRLVLPSPAAEPSSSSDPV